MESERNTIEKLSTVSDVKMSSQKQLEIWDNIEREIDHVKPSQTRRRTNIISSSAAVVAAVAIVAGGLYALSNNGLKSRHPGTLTTSNQPTSTNNTSQSKQQPGFNFSQYLPFTPLLPSYTAGHPLTHSSITRFLNTPQNGNSISYSVSYGHGENGFTIIEGQPNQLHLAHYSGHKTDITLGKHIHATMQTQKLNGTESIQFTRNGVLYDVSTFIKKGVSIKELKEICNSINVPATQEPTSIHISDNGPQSASKLSFKPVKAGQFYVPKGFSLNVQGASINIKGNSRSESFQITYKKGASYLTIVQTTQHEPDSSNVTVFTIPQTNVHVVVSSNISSTKVKKVVNSFLSVAKQHTGQ